MALALRCGCDISLHCAGLPQINVSRNQPSSFGEILIFVGTASVGAISAKEAMLV